MTPEHKVVLVVRDGWGYAKKTQYNFIANTHLPNTKTYMKKYPNTLLNASGEAVGLPKGYMGNSEVGHLTIGSGRIIFQSLERINRSIKDKSFFKNSAFISAIDNCKKNNTALHIIALLQTEGVHSHINHLFALLELCKNQDFRNVYIHAITDGRDSPPTESLKHVIKLQKRFIEIGFGEISTISGRYYAMDRNCVWDRTKKSYDAIMSAKGDTFDDPVKCVKACHREEETDEFIIPRVRLGYAGVNKNDSVIFVNFRTDRPRQLTSAIVEKGFKDFEREFIPVHFVAMTQYYEPMSAEVAFRDIPLKNLLGEVISSNGLRQLRISETEKYAHVTFFFNGQSEKKLKGEDMIMIPSPHVATYDLAPEMSAAKVASTLETEIAAGKYDFIVTNLVNADMVGHTGIKPSIKKALVAVDDALKVIVDASLKNGYTVLVLADHGNAEDKSAKYKTSHTMNPVPCILISEDARLKKTKLNFNKGLSDIAPTVLKLMGIKQPKEMTGKSLY